MSRRMGSKRPSGESGPSSRPTDSSGRTVKLTVTPDLVMLADRQSPAAERFVRLKADLAVDMPDKPKVIVVTSPMPGDGKSFVAINLALALAGDGETRTLLIDADLRRPGLHRRLRPEPERGLTEVLEGKTQLGRAVAETEVEGLEVLAAPHRAEDPGRLLATNSFRELVESLRKEYDRIVIDTPPAVAFADAELVAGCSDGVILVARSWVTPRYALEEAIDTIRAAPLLGIVLNAATANLLDRAHDYDRCYYEYRKQSDER